MSEEYYFHSHSFTPEDIYLKTIVEHLLCAINEVAHGLWPQDVVSSESTRITQISPQSYKIRDSLHFPWSEKAPGSSLPCVSCVILGSYLTTLSFISYM